MPKVSVIIPVYRVEKTLRRCVDSVLEQSFSDIEVILVNDGSPDSCGEICDEYSGADARVRVIHKENGGLSSARNAGLELAAGEYVMFLDSDDHLVPEALEHLLKGTADWIIGTVISVSHTQTVTHQPKRESELFGREQFGEEMPLLMKERRMNYIHGNLYRRELIEKHKLDFEDDKLSYGEDTVFNFSFLPHCESIYVCGHPVHYYMKSADGLASVYRRDRYQKSRRLSDLIESSCRSMGFDSEAVLAEINRRRVQSAVWCTDAICRAKGISFNDRCNSLRVIARDRRLKKIIPDAEVERKEEVALLIKKGATRYLLGKRLYKKFGPRLVPVKAALFRRGRKVNSQGE